MIKLSVVIITLNEEKNLRRCLESVKNVADEILVVDSISTDNTVKIAVGYGAKIILQKFLGHIEQKNFAAQKASHDWVLSLDADECLSPELEQSILKTKNSPTCNAYRFPRLNNFCGTWIKHCGWYPDAKIRLFNRTKGKWTGENPHDKWALDNLNEKEGLLKGDLLHYSFNSISDYVKKIEKYSEIAARLRVEKGINYSIFKIMVVPQWKLFADFILRLGFLDGYAGWLVCRLNAMETMIKYAKTRQYAQWKKEGKQF
ncbi:MAG: glycosyltransferase family 2 protein [Bacteroidetes bacterium]|nr:glycosyltransferase family 2 protein [Bacteroidota bacterium]